MQPKYKRVLLKPYSKNVKFEEKDGKISFALKENGGYVLECDSYHHALYIFNSKPIPAPKKEDVTYYFDAGIHFPGKITLKSNESVYVDKDALVKDHRQRSKETKKIFLQVQKAGICC